MIVKLIKNYKVSGGTLKKGTEIAVTREKAIELCEDGIAVAETDLPCEDRKKKAARVKSKKNKKATEKDSEVQITNKL